MDNETLQKIWLGIAAIGGGIMVEGLRRAWPSADKEIDAQISREAKVFDAQIKREEILAAKEKDLRQALWDELQRTMARVTDLEEKLDQATSIIASLSTANQKLKTEIQDLTFQLTKFTNEMRDKN